MWKVNPSGVGYKPVEDPLDVNPVYIMFISPTFLSAARTGGVDEEGGSADDGSWIANTLAPIKGLRTYYPKRWHLGILNILS